MPEFISAVEASKLTPVSASTIKRFIRDVVESPDHPSREKIEPSVAEFKRIQTSGEPYRWRIDREFVVEQFGAADKGGKGSDGSLTTPEIVLEILREQLAQKDSQIKTLETQLDRKDTQLLEQNERMKETHFLMQDLQRRLSLTAPASEPITVQEQSVKVEPHKKAKRPLFGGLFRRTK